MCASRTFETLLQQIQSSHLNFHLQVSPFSAVISLKKTFIRDRSGRLLLPPPQNPVTPTFIQAREDLAALTAKNKKLEMDKVILEQNYENSVLDCEAAYNIIRSLEEQIKNIKLKSESVDNDLNEIVKDQKETISFLENQLKT